MAPGTIKGGNKLLGAQCFLLLSATLETQCRAHSHTSQAFLFLKQVDWHRFAFKALKQWLSNFGPLVDMSGGSHSCSSPNLVSPSTVPA